MLASSMAIPMFVDFSLGHRDWLVFLLSASVTGFFGIILILSNNTKKVQITVKEAFILTTLSWIVLAFFSALPFMLSELKLSFTDAYFEAMSGITTTGSTVVTGLDHAPPGILLWRAILEWLGGIGIIVMALSVLPFLKVGGMQLFKMESSETQKAMPRATQLASSMGMVYLLLTLACIVAYTAAGMSLFDAVAHAMTTISTGGFSTHDDSFAYFNDLPAIDIICIIFMIIGSLPFVLYLRAWNGSWKGLFTDTQVHGFFGILIAAIGSITLYLVYYDGLETFDAIRKAAFNVTSIMTGTGYASDDFFKWGIFAVIVFFFLTCVGGCAGSTSCGIKIFRFQVLFSVALTQMRQLIHPHGVFRPYYNKKPIPQDVPAAVMSFFFIFAMSFSVIALLLSLTGLDFLTSMSGAVTSVSNVGPALGSVIGPGGTFQSLPDSSKWVLCLGMLLGRLELFTVLVLFVPRFWKK